MRSSTEYETPQDFFDRLDREFHFTLDAAATPENAKCKKFFTQLDDAFRHKWKGVVWLNPPFNKEIGQWIKKAYLSSQEGATVVCLIQARSTETVWWHKYAMKAYEIRFIENRLHFGLDGKSGRANFGSLLLIFQYGDFQPFCSSMHA